MKRSTWLRLYSFDADSFLDLIIRKMDGQLSNSEECFLKVLVETNTLAREWYIAAMETFMQQIPLLCDYDYQRK
jgi:hypothetical protein